MFPLAVNAWGHLRELVLRRCHSIKLADFCQFIPLLPVIEAIHLELMFREPPKGCSRFACNSKGNYIGEVHTNADGIQIQMAYKYIQHTNTDGIQIQTAYKYRWHTNTDGIQIQTAYKYRWHTNVDDIQIQMAYKCRRHTNTDGIQIQTA